MSSVLVLGAGGPLGLGIVDAALESGRPVLAVAESADAVEALQTRAGDGCLDVFETALANEDNAAALARRIDAGGHRLDGVVAAIGGESACGRLLDQPAEVLRRTLDEELLPHLAAARHLFPLLTRQRRSGYVLVGGPGADYPWAGYGHRSIAAAALRMLARVLHEEARQAGLQVHLLSVQASERGPGPCSSLDMPWPQARAAGRRALSLLEAPPATERCVVAWPPPRSLTSTKVEAARCAPLPVVDAKDVVDRLLASPVFSRNPTS
ncbi:SDR family NAD(P)-dependent oxidoreductase [Luteimonas abyssi]|uniref:SDR family NAD(P)-dependent oxidoreductase n=1 Tax=Luteimonas abyssi TaxID=1247514 RepID=UPI0009E94AEB|nr:SDR family NAD(P)-dependent oxidoreductase [Luteimonas abyssi]